MIHQGEQIDALIKEKGFGKGNLAKELGISRQGLDGILNKSKVDAKWHEAICKALDLQADFFKNTEGVTQVANGNGGNVHQSNGATAELYERLLSERKALLDEKDERIGELKEMINLLKQKN